MRRYRYVRSCSSSDSTQVANRDNPLNLVPLVISSINVAKGLTSKYSKVEKSSGQWTIMTGRCDSVAGPGALSLLPQNCNVRSLVWITFGRAMQSLSVLSTSTFACETQTTKVQQRCHNPYGGGHYLVFSQEISIFVHNIALLAGAHFAQLQPDPTAEQITQNFVPQLIGIL